QPALRIVRGRIDQISAAGLKLQIPLRQENADPRQSQAQRQGRQRKGDREPREALQALFERSAAFAILGWAWHEQSRLWIHPKGKCPFRASCVVLSRVVAPRSPPTAHPDDCSPRDNRTIANRLLPQPVVSEPESGPGFPAR